ncbi:MAG: 3-dehydroquinate synthase [Anaerolineae bacterium]|nr:3-dehydroquinate synthase [Anaerolineae bacterium]
MSRDLARNLVLTGFMGSGKTEVGRAVAEHLGRRFVDMDEVLARRLGMSVPDIFRRLGEPFFRAEESRLARELADERELVIATGGGTLVDRGNREALGATGLLVRLTASPEALWERVSGTRGRPMLEAGDRRGRMEELLQQREPAYREIPHQVDTTGLAVEQVVARVVDIAANAEHTGERALGVHYPGGFYPVFVTRGGLKAAGLYLRSRGLVGRVAVIGDDTVVDLWGETLVRGLAERGLDATVLRFPAGERSKTLATVESLVTDMVEAGLGRDCIVIALGGGVVGDTAGLVAALYMRGVPLVQVPTTLLAAFDSSVGGKVAVDLPAGKNLVGAFKQPDLVLVDAECMETLPNEERRAGLAEAVKHGVIADPELFRRLETGQYDLLEVIERSIRVKVGVVEEDPYEQGRRAVLNLGHTFGHAYEKLSDFRLRHGEAVAIGMVLAARLARHRGLTAPDLEERLVACLQTTGLPVKPPPYVPDAVLGAMQADKKRRAGRLRFVLPLALGDVRVYDDVTEEELRAVLPAGDS